jgi:glycosyltransferase involved in cell wall biosynthesis
LKNGNWRLEIAGDGPLRPSLKKLAQDLKIADQVVFLGQVHPDEIPKLLTRAHIFVRPSCSEGLGSSFLEAMAAGLPVIGTPVGGIPDFLKDGETGLFCEPGNPKSIAAAIKRLLDDASLRERLAINGQKLVREKYDWSLIAQQMNRLF